MAELLQVAEVTSSLVQHAFFLSSLVTEPQFHWAVMLPPKKLHFPAFFTVRLGRVLANEM